MSIAAMLAIGCQTEPQPVASDPAEAVMANILNRKSVRSYTSDTIPAAVMENLLRAAMAAPSGRDIRPWSFVVLTDTARYDEIFGDNFNMRMYKQSAAVVVICADTTVVRPPRDNPDAPAVQQPNGTWRDDMGAVTENLFLGCLLDGLLSLWRPYGSRQEGSWSSRHRGALLRGAYRLPWRWRAAQRQVGLLTHPLQPVVAG